MSIIDALFKSVARALPELHLHPHAPESIPDTPALVLFGVDATSDPNTYRGGRLRTYTYTIALLVTERRQLHEAIETLRRSHEGLVRLLEEETEWQGDGWEARTSALSWSEGVTEYAGTMYMSVTFTVEVEQHLTAAVAPCR